MPIHVGQMTTEVTALDGELPLSAAQVEALVQLLLERIEQREKEKAQARDATSVRGQATPPRSGW